MVFLTLGLIFLSLPALGAEKDYSQQIPTKGGFLESFETRSAELDAAVFVGGGGHSVSGGAFWRPRISSFSPRIGVNFLRLSSGFPDMLIQFMAAYDFAVSEKTWIFSPEAGGGYALAQRKAFFAVGFAAYPPLAVPWLEAERIGFRYNYIKGDNPVSEFAATILWKW